MGFLDDVENLVVFKPVFYFLVLLSSEIAFFENCAYAIALSRFWEIPEQRFFESFVDTGLCPVSAHGEALRGFSPAAIGC